MRARIARTIVGVTALVVVVLGLPLAILIQRFYESRATVELQRSAAEAIAELSLPLRVDEIASAAREPDAPPEFSVYDSAGGRLYGSGPARVDVPESSRIVVISPITDRTTETVVGSVRVSRARSDIAGQARRAWALMAMGIAGGLALSVLVARREAARLAAPISELAMRAERLGAGEFDLAPLATGTAELDTVADALGIASRRLAELLAREREFSANTSHQLRTPLAALRVSLDRGDLASASAEADRLAATVSHMLALARDALPTSEVIRIGPIIDDAVRRWNPGHLAKDRRLIVAIDADLPGVQIRPNSIDQVLDVLLDNALRHGAGDTRIIASTAPGGVVVRVDDDGSGIPVDRVHAVFDRNSGTSSRIGLALARTLVEADGGRLVLADPEHAEFRIVFSAARSTA